MHCCKRAFISLSCRPSSGPCGGVSETQNKSTEYESRETGRKGAPGEDAIQDGPFTSIAAIEEEELGESGSLDNRGTSLLKCIRVSCRSGVDIAVKAQQFFFCQRRSEFVVQVEV